MTKQDPHLYNRFTAGRQVLPKALCALFGLAATMQLCRAAYQAISFFNASSIKTAIPIKDIYATLNDPCVTTIAKGDVFTVRVAGQSYQIKVVSVDRHAGKPAFESVATTISYRPAGTATDAAYGTYDQRFTPSVLPKNPQECRRQPRELNGMLVTPHQG